MYKVLRLIGTRLIKNIIICSDQYEFSIERAPILNPIF